MTSDKIPLEGDWLGIREELEPLRRRLFQLCFELPSQMPGIDRTNGLLAYLRAALCCLEGAQEFAGQRVPVSPAIDAGDALSHPVLDGAQKSEDACEHLGRALEVVAGIDVDEDTAEQHWLTLPEFRLTQAVADLTLLQEPRMAALLRSVRSTGAVTPDGRREFAVFWRKDCVEIVATWWAEPGMRVEKVVSALEKRLRNLPPDELGVTHDGETRDST